MWIDFDRINRITNSYFAFKVLCYKFTRKDSKSYIFLNYLSIFFSSNFNLVNTFNETFTCDCLSRLSKASSFRKSFCINCQCCTFSVSDNHILELFTFFDGLFMVGYIKIKSNTITWSYFKGKVCECCRNTTIRIVVVNFHTCLLVFSCFQYTISFKSISDSVS